MNTQNIYAGEYYAFERNRPNKILPMRATKGKAIRVLKEKEFGRERASMFVIFECERQDGSTYEIQVRARDVIDFWTDYEAERRHLLAERERREAQELQEREQRRREYEARLAREREERERKEQEETVRKEKLRTALLERTGLPENAIYSIGPQSVTLDRTILEFWLTANGSTHQA